MANAEEIVRRRAALVNCIATSSVPLTTKQVRVRAGLASLTIRTIQRDLDELGAEGRIRWDDEASGWIAGGERIEEELDRLLSFTALRVFEQIFDNLLPRSIQTSLAKRMREYRKRIENGQMFSVSEANWLEALLICPAYHWFENPIIDPKVRDAIEDAILNKRRLRLRMKYLPHGPWWHTHEDEWVEVSVHHFVLELPSRPSIIIERHDLRDDGGIEYAAGDVRSIWPLEMIVDAEVLTSPSVASRVTTQCSTAFEPRYQSLVLSVDPLLLEELAGTWFVSYLTSPELGGGLIGTSAIDGWGVYRMRCPDGPITELQRQQQSLIGFLSRWSEYIEVIEPYGLRTRMRSAALSVAARYQDEQIMPESQHQQIVDGEIAEVLAHAEKDPATLWWFDPALRKIVLPSGVG